MTRPQDERSYKSSYRMQVLAYITGSDYVYVQWSTKGTRPMFPTWPPCILYMGDISFDNDRFARSLFVLDLTLPQVVYKMAGGVPTTENRNNGRLLLQEFQNLAGASIILYCDATVTSGVAYTTENVLQGRIVKLTGTTHTTATFEIELRSELNTVDFPRNILERTILTTLEKPLIMQENAGEVFPVAFGNRLPFLRSDMYGGFGDNSNRCIAGLFGWRQPFAPCLGILRGKRSVIATGSPVFSVYGEKIAAGLTMNNTANTVQTYIDTNNGMCQVYGAFSLGGVNPGIGAQLVNGWNLGYAMELEELPWVTFPMPVTLDPSTVLNALNNPSGACDDDPNTYTTIPNGTTLDYIIPKMEPIGRISRNSTILGSDTYDDEHDPGGTGVGKPCGICAAALLVHPSGEPVGVGSVNFSFCYGDGSPFLSCTSANTPPSADSPVFMKAQVPYRNATGIGTITGGGWAGTKFGTWDFISCPTNSGYDKTLYYAVNAETPFRLRVNNASGQDVFLASIKLLIGCRLYTEPWRAQMNALPTRVAKWQSEKTLHDIWLYRLSQEHPYDIAPVSSYRTTGITRSAWRRGGGASFVESKVLNPGVSISANMYVHDSTWLGEAVGAVITKPAHIAAYIAQKYSGATFETRNVNTTFGHPWDVQSILDHWVMDSGNETWGARVWTCNPTWTGQQDADSAIKAVLAHCLGARLVRKPNGEYRMIVWVPRSLATAFPYNDLYRAGVAAPLNAITSDSYGIPIISFDGGDVANVVNDIEITYGAGYSDAKLKKVARASAGGSDDGYGEEWGNAGVLPGGSSTTAQELCAWSKLHFGPPGVLTRPWKYTVDTDDPNIAVAVGLGYLCRGYRPPLTITFTGTQYWADMVPGQVFRLSDTLRSVHGFYVPGFGVGKAWENCWWRCESNYSKDVGTGARVQQITALYIPYYLGEEIVSPLIGATEDDQFILGVIP